jgi:hypothetical protein
MTFPAELVRAKAQSRPNLVDFGDLEIDAQLNCVEHGVIGFADRIGADTGWAVLRHEHAIGSVKLHY